MTNRRHRLVTKRSIWCQWWNSDVCFHMCRCMHNLQRVVMWLMSCMCMQIFHF